MYNVSVVRVSTTLLLGLLLAACRSESPSMPIDTAHRSALPAPRYFVDINDPWDTSGLSDVPADPPRVLNLSVVTMIIKRPVDRYGQPTPDVSSSTGHAFVSGGFLSEIARVRLRAVIKHRVGSGPLMEIEDFKCDELQSCVEAHDFQLSCSVYNQVKIEGTATARFLLSSFPQISDEHEATCKPANQEEEQLGPPELDPCDDPTTEEIETDFCADPWNPQSYGGSRFDIVEVSEQSGGGGRTWSCMVTDWYESTNGSPWSYTGSTVDYSTCLYGPPLES